MVIERRRNAESSNLEQEKETEGQMNNHVDKESLGIKRTTAAYSPDKYETFVDNNASSPSPPKPTHTKPTVDEILSSLSSILSDLDDEPSDANSSSSAENVTHLFHQNAPPTPIPSPNTTFDVKLPVGIQFSYNQTLEHNKAANIVGKNIRGYRKLQLDKIEALKTIFRSGLSKTPSKPISKSKHASTHNSIPRLTQTNTLENFESANTSALVLVTEFVQEPPTNSDLNHEPHSFIKPTNEVTQSSVAATIPISHIFTPF